MIAQHKLYRTTTLRRAKSSTNKRHVFSLVVKIGMAIMPKQIIAPAAVASTNLLLPSPPTNSGLPLKEESKQSGIEENLPTTQSSSYSLADHPKLQASATKLDLDIKNNSLKTTPEFFEQNSKVIEYLKKEKANGTYSEEKFIKEYLIPEYEKIAGIAPEPPEFAINIDLTKTPILEFEKELVIVFGKSVNGNLSVDIMRIPHYHIGVINRISDIDNKLYLEKAIIVTNGNPIDIRDSNGNLVAQVPTMAISNKSNKQIRVNPPKGEKDQFVTLTTQNRVFEKYRIVDQTELENDLKPDVVYALVCQETAVGLQLTPVGTPIKDVIARVEHLRTVELNYIKACRNVHVDKVKEYLKKNEEYTSNREKFINDNLEVKRVLDSSEQEMVLESTKSEPSFQDDIPQQSSAPDTTITPTTTTPNKGPEFHLID